MSAETAVRADAEAVSASFASAFGARTECGHDDSAQKITLLESSPPSTWCGACVELMRELSDAHREAAMSGVEVYAALVQRGWSEAQAEQFVMDLEKEDAA